MRTFLGTHWKAIAALIVLVLLALFAVPTGTASPALAARLQARADGLAQHAAGSAGLDNASRYIAATLAAQGYRVHWQRDGQGGHAVRKVEAWLGSAQPGRQPSRNFILATSLQPADDDALADTAAMLELARLIKDLHPTAGTDIRFVFFIGRALPADAPYGSFIAYAGPGGALAQAREALAFFRSPPDGTAGVLAAPAWIQGVTLGHLQAAGSADNAMLLADIGALQSPCLPAAGRGVQPNYKTIARTLLQLARTVNALAGTGQG
ncbi:MAG: hypothetical protein ACXWC4_20830 [Telluria sp.]